MANIYSDETGTHWTYLNMPHEKRYKISFDVVTNQIFIYERKTTKIEFYTPMEFVYNSAGFNEKVNKYPNYVHKAVWMLYDHTKNL